MLVALFANKYWKVRFQHISILYWTLFSKNEASKSSRQSFWIKRRPSEPKKSTSSVIPELSDWDLKRPLRLDVEFRSPRHSRRRSVQSWQWTRRRSWTSCVLCFHTYPYSHVVVVFCVHLTLFFVLQFLFCFFLLFPLYLTRSTCLLLSILFNTERERIPETGNHLPQQEGRSQEVRVPIHP